MNHRQIYQCPFYKTELCPAENQEIDYWDNEMEYMTHTACHDPLITDEEGDSICRIYIDIDLVKNNDMLRKELSCFKMPSHKGSCAS
jgi:hypothetical protein